MSWMGKGIVAGHFLAIGPATWTAGPDSPIVRQMEALGRGLMAIVQEVGSVFLSWWRLGTDPDDDAFHLFRTTGVHAPVWRNDEPIAATTIFEEENPEPWQAFASFVRPVFDGQEQEPRRDRPARRLVP